MIEEKINKKGSVNFKYKQHILAPFISQLMTLGVSWLLHVTALSQGADHKYSWSDKCERRGVSDLYTVECIRMEGYEVTLKFFEQNNDFPVF